MSLKLLLKNNLVNNIKKRGATLLFRDSDNNYIETNNNNLVSQTVCGVKFTFKAGEFFQNNNFVIPLMVEHVINKAIGDNCNYMIDGNFITLLFLLLYYITHLIIINYIISLLWFRIIFSMRLKTL
jgi:hypothetical protein